MELDDLRRQWQQAPAVPQVPPAELRRLLSQQSTSLIAKMRRSVWAEIIVSTGLALFPLLFLHNAFFQRLYVGVLVLMVGVFGYYYTRQLSILKKMGQVDVSIRGHLQVLSAGLRQLLRFYYYLTLWTGPVTLLLVLGYYSAKEMGRAAGPRWTQLGVVVAVVLVLGLIFQFGIIYFTRWYLQRLYGRHLDRLEGQMRELNEPVGGMSSVASD
ncbi:MAG: hypothetical protein ACRYFZ_00180 [Janthinobacterium lividum]